MLSYVISAINAIIYIINLLIINIMRKAIFILPLMMFVFVASSVVLAAPNSQATDRVYILSDSAIYKTMLGVNHEFKGLFSTKGVKRAKALEKLGLIKTAPVGIFTVSAPPNKCGDGDCQGYENELSCPVDCASVIGSRDYYPSTQYPWGVEMVNGGSGGDGILVAVLDTGLASHPDLSSVACISTLITPSCVDGHGHGTHVAGTILANGGDDGLGIYGVAPQAELLAIKVLDDEGSGYGDDVAEGITTAVDMGAKIISMSLGSLLPDPGILEAVQYAFANEVLVVAASGNYFYGTETMSYPGAYAEVVGVGAIDSSKNITYFSIPGLLDDGDDSTIVEGEIEFAAPGYSVESTYLSDRYASMSGTSMATPHVAALAAKLWQGNALDTRAYLKSIAIDIAGDGYDISSGYGMPVAPVSTLTCADNEITCDGVCTVPACTVSSCNDGDTSTTDTCINPDSCDAVCEYAIPSTGSVCGDKVCEGDETWATCPRDCKR